MAEVRPFCLVGSANYEPPPPGILVASGQRDPSTSLTKPLLPVSCGLTNLDSLNLWGLPTPPLLALTRVLSHRRPTRKTPPATSPPTPPPPHPAGPATPRGDGGVGVRRHGALVNGSKFRVSGFGLKVAGCGCEVQVSELGFRVS